MTVITDTVYEVVLTPLTRTESYNVGLGYSDEQWTLFINAWLLYTSPNRSYSPKANSAGLRQRGYNTGCDSTTEDCTSLSGQLLTFTKAGKLPDTSPAWYVTGTS